MYAECDEQKIGHMHMLVAAATEVDDIMPLGWHFAMCVIAMCIIPARWMVHCMLSNVLWGSCMRKY